MNRQIVQTVRLRGKIASGNLFRDQLADALRAEGRTVYAEVFKSTSFGGRYMDLDVWHNGVNLGE
ncbi:hypothetical protein QE382_003788 [Sphingobacterium zeae]|uniref:DUF4325 domain-containing protein n=1 Tax=Sphingobacterium zeae TaxID=1776859 RepID=A0ABU0UAF3_9SPHI|nr:hypothetical protein [Sphingobacterium zeae]MDQ1151804.1 hypothetical protein [Sphingobacterium zeae]